MRSPGDGYYTLIQLSNLESVQTLQINYHVFFDQADNALEENRSVLFPFRQERITPEHVFGGLTNHFYIKASFA